ncbi:uncharacterized protein PV09_05993 [Verruconis gallopava]|uniref:Xaa-Pro dipeptidyl-peptidase-like domain-containing protein n=1 Tax=Verruconis gallopava TaxID=253628 RepID=A0A0D2A7M5_9PEZI|nr:uncharacterized protein PV09_05993 [Verruconis gallopava]KIW02535.1 hypothetical protein PV09_05993 [Verruconis gallopava]
MTSKDQWIVTEGAPRLAARVYEPTKGNVPYPVVIFATGLGTVKENRTSSFVKPFAHAGYASVTFDYATWGESDGEPRHTIRPNDQYRDMCNVVAWVRQQMQFDSARIVVWGSSFGGLHVTRLLAEDYEIAAGISQCPCVDAALASRMKPFTTTLRIGFWAVLDLLGSVLGFDPIYLACAKMKDDNYQGPALMEAPDVAEGYALVVNNSSSPFKNRLTARSILSFPAARPALLADKITAPYLIVVPEYDTVAPLKAAQEVAEKAKNGELITVPGGHFDLYDGKIGFEKNIQAQLQFLQSKVPARISPNIFMCQ